MFVTDYVNMSCDLDEKSVSSWGVERAKNADNLLCWKLQMCEVGFMTAMCLVRRRPGER